MDLTSSSFADGGEIPDRYALGTPAPVGHVTFSADVNPELAWGDVPEGTRSFALICFDPDCPSSGEDVNKEDREVPADLARVDFVHWTLVDLPSSLRKIEEGEYASGVVAHGRQERSGPHGSRQGLNDYTGWFQDDPDMEGRFLGYDGPGPPWNDALIHHYLFELFALDVERLDLDDDFTADQIMGAIDGHILATASHIGTYTLNPRLRN
jgi:Raf kinase inhibitor-like YbhB/YbcL family protein